MPSTKRWAPQWMPTPCLEPTRPKGRGAGRKWSALVNVDARPCADVCCRHERATPVTRKLLLWPNQMIGCLCAPAGGQVSIDAHGEQDTCGTTSRGRHAARVNEAIKIIEACASTPVPRGRQPADFGTDFPPYCTEPATLSQTASFLLVLYLRIGRMVLDTSPLQRSCAESLPWRQPIPRC